MEFGQTQGGVAEDTRLDAPPEYRVILLNDDYTTKDFVVYVLERVFHKDKTQAVQIMESVHRSGRGVAGVYTYDIAATRAQMTMSMARQEGFPLRCELERC